MFNIYVKFVLFLSFNWAYFYIISSFSRKCRDAMI